MHTRHHRGSRPRGTSCVFFLPTPARVLGCLALNFHPHPFPTPPFGPACAPALPFSRTVSFIWLAGVSSRLCVCGRGWDKGATRTHVSSRCGSGCAIFCRQISGLYLDCPLRSFLCVAVLISSRRAPFHGCGCAGGRWGKGATYTHVSSQPLRL